MPEKTAKKTAPRKRGADEISRTNLHLIPYSRLEVEPEFNKRISYGDIDELAHDIGQHGILHPLHVQAIPGKKDRYYVREGHRRFQALQLLNSKGKDVGKIPCIITNDTKEIAYIKMAASNTGLPFSLLEKGLIFLELEKFGYSAKDMQERFDVKNIGRVYDALKLAKAPKKLHVDMGSGKVSQTLVLQLLRETDENWEEIAQRLKGASIVAKNEAQRDGVKQKKVTAKHVKNLANKTPLQKLIEVKDRAEKKPDNYVKTNLTFLSKLIEILQGKGTPEDILELMKK